jgi:hypothetical protein
MPKPAWNNKLQYWLVILMGQFGYKTTSLLVVVKISQMIGLVQQLIEIYCMFPGYGIYSQAFL